MLPILFLNFVLANNVFANQAGGASPGVQAADRVIVIEEREVTRQPARPHVFVESDTDVIMGEPQENFRAAHRSWQAACDRWKADLRENNGSNLMIASCGEFKRREEKIRLQTFFTVSSQATYKIKVGCE